MSRRGWIAWLIAGTLLAGPETASAGGKVALYGMHMLPQSSSATDYSDDAWGGGLHAVIPWPQVHNLLALNVGLEGVNFFSASRTVRDPQTLLRVDQNTGQDMFRFYVGAEAGAHGRAFLRPHAGVNLALAHYSIGTTLVIPNDSDPEHPITQNLDSRSTTRFGSDVTLGLDLNFVNTVSLDGGLRYVKNFGVPAYLGQGSVTLHPDYIQYYLSLGLSFDFIRRRAD